MNFRHRFSFSRRGIFASKLPGCAPRRGQGAPRDAGLVHFPHFAMRGTERRKAQTVLSGRSLIGIAAPSGAPPAFSSRKAKRWRAYLAAPRRRLSPATPAPGPRFLGRGSERALPGFACPSPASFSRSGHDAARAETPEPPGSGVTTPARRHRTLSRSQGVPLGAPLVEKVERNISL